MAFIDYKPDELKPLYERARNTAFAFQRRRHKEWDENYSLYRLRVKPNIFLQRQSVCLPIVKSTVRTVLSQTQSPSTVKFFNKDNDKQKEIYMNGVWEKFWKYQNGALIDALDKKNVGIFGRSAKAFLIKNGLPIVNVADPYDILYDPACDPTNIDFSSSYIIRLNIVETVEEVKANPWYEKSDIDKLLANIDSISGKQYGQTGNEQARTNRLYSVGASSDSSLSPLTELAREDFFVKLPNKETGEGERIYLVPVVASQPMACIPLSIAIGETSDNFWNSHFPFDSWADDVDPVDVYSDSVADIARDPNKLMNTWWSQEVENRTLKNLSMFFYNSSDERFIPQTFNPYAWAFFPVPGNPSELIQQIPIPDLSGTLEQISFVKQMVEQATAATATMQGQLEKNKVTLGEVTMALSNAQARIQASAAYYTKSWHDTAIKMYKLIEAGANANYLGSVSMVRIGSRGNAFLQNIDYKDLITRHGYEVQVAPANVAEAQDMDTLQKLNLAINSMPENAALKRIYKEKLLDTTTLTPEQINEIKQAEEQAIEQKENEILNAMGGQNMMPSSLMAQELPPQTLGRNNEPLRPVHAQGE